MRTPARTPASGRRRRKPAGPYDSALAAAGDALDRGDLGGAIQAYQNVLSDDPGNVEATLGLAQAELLRRVEGLDPAAVRKEAADNPADVAAQIRVADLDLVGGHVEDALGRLVDTVARTMRRGPAGRAGAAAGTVRGRRRRRSAGGGGAAGAGACCSEQRLT